MCLHGVQPDSPASSVTCTNSRFVLGFKSSEVSDDLKTRTNRELRGPSMFTVKAKIYGVSIINPALSLLMKHLVIGQRQKASNFSAFHWLPHGSLVSIGQHFVAKRVVHLPKMTETSLITESDRSGHNHRIGPGCAGRE